jgi:diketogulonate reductase-like aldo/keto reductase
MPIAGCGTGISTVTVRQDACAGSLSWVHRAGRDRYPETHVPKSHSENNSLFDWELDDSGHQRLDTIDRDRPVYDTPTRDWSRDVYGISC